MENLMAHGGGFYLVDLSNGLWMFKEVDGDTKIGAFSEVVLTAILRYNFKINEIEAAVQNMIEENHNAAHFGIWRTFMYSLNYKFSVERRAV